jgi:hypothetical protein
VPPLEAPTREELQQKIQANIAEALGAGFPGLKLPSGDQHLKFAFHIEHKPGGGFSIQSADPNAPAVEGASHEDIASHFAEKFLAFAGNHFMPELAQALDSQGGSGEVKVFVNKTTYNVNRGSGKLTLTTENNAGPADSQTALSAGAQQLNGSLDSALVSNSPIVPESSGSWPVFRFLLALLVLAGLMYLFLHR